MLYILRRRLFSVTSNQSLSHIHTSSSLLRLRGRPKLKPDHAIDNTLSHSFSRLFPLLAQTHTLSSSSASARIDASKKLLQRQSKFIELGISPSLASRLAKWNIQNPTNIQAMAIPEILAAKNVVVHAPTNTGKTLTFLLPLVQNLLNFYKRHGNVASANRPSALILSPVTELSHQILKILHDLGSPLGISSKGSWQISKAKMVHKKTGFSSGVLDVLVSTPGKFWELKEKQLIGIERLKYLVIDEADYTVFFKNNKDNYDIFCQILKFFKHRTDMADAIANKLEPQFILTGATLTYEEYTKFAKIIPNLVHVQDEFANCIVDAKNVRPQFIRVKNLRHKLQEIRVLTSKKIIGQSSIIFCNSTDTCKQITSILKNETGHQIFPFHSGIHPKERLKNLNDFMTSESDGFSATDKVNEGTISYGPAKKILVATDVAFRGLDFTQVQSIILYDFSRRPEDYLHRVGRLRRGGTVISLITPSDESLAKSLFEMHVHRKKIDTSEVDQITDKSYKYPQAQSHGWETTVFSKG